MEFEPFLRSFSVPRVSDDGVPSGGQLNSYLMCAAREQAHEEQGVFSPLRAFGYAARFQSGDDTAGLLPFFGLGSVNGLHSLGFLIFS